MFDARKRYYGDLISSRPRSSEARDATTRDWVLLRGLRGAGAHFRFRVDEGQRLIERFRESALVLPPGRYFIQAIYSHRIIEAPPSTPDGQRSELQARRWNDPRIDSEKFRSNIVEIQIASGSCRKAAAHEPALSNASPQSARELGAQFDLNCGERRGRATISMGLLKLPIGASLGISVRFENTSGDTYQVFNPFFNRLVHEPAALAIFDRDKQYVGDLLCFELGSTALAEPTEWPILPPGGACEATLPIIGGHVPCTMFSSKERRLPPGKYYLQLIYRPCFATSAPDTPIASPCSPFKNRADEALGECCGDDKVKGSDVLLRSNILEIELVAKPRRTVAAKE